MHLDDSTNSMHALRLTTAFQNLLATKLVPIDQDLHLFLTMAPSFPTPSASFTSPLRQDPSKHLLGQVSPTENDKEGMLPCSYYSPTLDDEDDGFMLMTMHALAGRKQSKRKGRLPMTTPKSKLEQADISPSTPSDSSSRMEMGSPLWEVPPIRMRPRSYQMTQLPRFSYEEDQDELPLPSVFPRVSLFSITTPGSKKIGETDWIPPVWLCRCMDETSRQDEPEELPSSVLMPDI